MCHRAQHEKARASGVEMRERVSRVIGFREKEIGKKEMAVIHSPSIPRKGAKEHGVRVSIKLVSLS